MNKIIIPFVSGFICFGFYHYYTINKLQQQNKILIQNIKTQQALKDKNK
jgi:hypothetical protein